jgi:hypothetical protein
MMCTSSANRLVHLTLGPPIMRYSRILYGPNSLVVSSVAEKFSHVMSALANIVLSILTGSKIQMGTETGAAQLRTSRKA